MSSVSEPNFTVSRSWKARCGADEISLTNDLQRLLFVLNLRFQTLCYQKHFFLMISGSNVGPADVSQGVEEQKCVLQHLKSVSGFVLERVQPFLRSLLPTTAVCLSIWLQNMWAHHQYQKMAIREHILNVIETLQEVVGWIAIKAQAFVVLRDECLGCEC